MNLRAQAILQYWFGSVDEIGLPSKNHMKIWFSGATEVDQEIREKFLQDHQNAVSGKYIEWISNPRECLALIILLDQFSRNLYRNAGPAYENDAKALDICLQSIDQQFDHHLSLIERAFCYMPLQHAENLDMQTTSVRAFNILVGLSFPEARAIFQTFLDHAVKQYEVIKRFGRFPHRNVIMGRESTQAELEFLAEHVTGWE